MNGRKPATEADLCSRRQKAAVAVHLDGSAANLATCPAPPHRPETSSPILTVDRAIYASSVLFQVSLDEST